MLSFIMISDESLESLIYHCFSTLGTVQHQGDGSFYVQYCDDISKGQLFYIPSEDLYQDYEEEIVEIKKYIKKPFFHLLEFRNGDVNIADIFISKLSALSNIIIDNNHGEIMSLEDCKDRVLRGEDFMLSKH
ncbi:hypothetical protein [Psychrobacter pygoscelis]|uniref:hypothetical protein n=1 Tax=Psychrobacter pygoscelis TaxID=2488563 RepID=UPI00103A0D00|nr:hypothetical protein [Psychrobacter pygoscelis]